MASRGGCTFQDKWSVDPRFSSWIGRGKNANFALCKVCNNKQIDLTSMGATALVSHTKGIKHQEKLNFRSNSSSNLGLFFKAKASTPVSQSPSSSPSPSPQPSTSASTAAVSINTGILPNSSTGTLTSLVSRNDVLSAEVWWCLNMTDKNNSFSSNSDTQFLLQQMFPTSPVAQKLACAETKSMYMVVYGIAPFLLSLLKKRTENEPYVLMFDESLNKELQKKQLDLWVRLWNSDVVQSRYLNSSFLGHACTSDLLSAFEEKVEGCIGMANMVQLSMDGPNVNWSTFNQLQKKVENETSQKFINVGSCGLHQLHNAFRSAVSATKWDITQVLMSLHQLFKHTPARREDYEKITQQSIYPLKHCPHRWIENAKCCERALALHPHLGQYVEAVKKKTVKDPSTKSYETVVAWVNDPFAKAKLFFLISVARHLEKFLTIYQADKPMLPFLADDLENLLKKLLRKFIKTEHLDALTTFTKLAQFDPSAEEHQRVYTDLQLGCETEGELRDIKKKIKPTQLLAFRLECKALLVTLVKAIQVKSPLTYSLVPQLRCLDPLLIVQDHTKAADRFKKVAFKLKDLNRLKASEVDNIVEEFEDFVKAAVTLPSFKNFNKEKDRLDKLFYSTMQENSKFKHVWAVVRTLLLLSHGQAAVERGFSVNKECNDVNLSGECLVARRLVKDHLRSIGGLKSMKVSNELLISASGAHQKYVKHMEEKKAEKVKQTSSLKRKAAEDKICSMKKRFCQLEADHVHLIEAADKASLSAERLSNFSLLSQANCLRDKARQKTDEIQVLKAHIEEEEKVLHSTL